jgi:hypothetical protein
MIFANFSGLDSDADDSSLKFSAFSGFFVSGFLIMAFSPQISMFLRRLPSVQPKEEYMLIYQALADCL